MRQTITSHHFDDSDGNPAGGTTNGPGLTIGWQNGPLGIDGHRDEPNGCFVETVLVAALDRLEYYERSKFACDENKNAIRHIQDALTELGRRTRSREERGVEGTHQI